MSTLAEIEAAVETLPQREKAELLLFLTEKLRAEGGALPEPRLFSPEQLRTWMEEDVRELQRLREES